MDRRTLLTGASAALLARYAEAQPVPLGGPAGANQKLGPGPLGSGGPSLSLSFMNPGILDPRLTFARVSTATYFDSGGVMRTAAANTPRWDYDPATLALRGVLIEESRTNLIFPSVIGGVRWVSNGLLLGGSVTTPDGVVSTTALLNANDTTNSARTIDNSGNAIIGSTAYTASVYFKKNATNAFIQILTTGGANAASVAYFDLTAGTGIVGADLIAGHTNKSVTITLGANGWYRATYTITSVAGNNGLNVYYGPCMVISPTGDNRAYVGVVGQGVYAWGGQVEQGSFATSHIPTTSVGIVRGIDTCSMPTSVGWFNNDTFTIEEEITGVSVGWAGGAFAGLFDGGVTYFYLAIEGPLTTSFALSGFGGIGGGPPITRGVSKMAGAFSKNRMALAANGSAPAVNTSPTPVVPPMVRMAFGNDPWSLTTAGNLCVRKVNLWPRAMPDAELTAVTT